MDCFVCLFVFVDGEGGDTMLYCLSTTAVVGVTLAPRGGGLCWVFFLFMIMSGYTKRPLSFLSGLDSLVFHWIVGVWDWDLSLILSEVFFFVGCMRVCLGFLPGRFFVRVPFTDGWMLRQ